MFKKIKMMVALLVVGSMLLTSSCMSFSLGADKYENYKCFDQNLSYAQVSSLLKAAYFDRRTGDNPVIGSKDIVYREIKGINSKGFIVEFKKEIEFFNASYYTVYVKQNPQKYISVIDDWTIKDMHLCVLNAQDTPENSESSSVFKQFPLKNPKIAVLELGDLVEEFQVLRKSKKGEPYHNIAGTEPCNDVSGQLFLRLTFEESKNILWEAPVYCREEAECHKIWIYMTYPPASAQESGAQPLYIPLPEDSALYQQIYDYIDTLAEK